MLLVIISIIVIAIVNHFFSKCIRAYSLLCVKGERNERDIVLSQESIQSSVGGQGLQDSVVSVVVGKAHRVLRGQHSHPWELLRYFLEEVLPDLSLERETRLLDKTKNGNSAPLKGERSLTAL